MIERLRIIVGLAIAIGASCSCGAAELRGAWVSAWGPGYLTAGQIDATIAAARKAGINALFIQVRKNADAYYDSEIEARASDIAADFDPLAYAVSTGHAQGMQVHAWVNAFRVWTSKKPPADPKHIVNLHPEWINVDSKGNTRASEGTYLDPGVPAAREHIAKIVLDIANRYNVDGIQWDYIRYPSGEWGYSDAALARYYADTGATTKPAAKDPKWLAWKRDQVTALVKTASEQVRAIKPKLLITASTIAWGGCPAEFAGTEAYAVVCQDWKLWAEKGYIDANLPMCYKTERSTRSAQSFRNWLVGFGKWAGGKPVYVGIDVTQNDDAGVLAEIEAVRKAGLGGYVLFDFNQSQRRGSLVDAMAGAAKPSPEPAAGTGS